MTARRRFEEEKPYLDIDGGRESFTLPLLKWRELLFVGALVHDGDTYRRDPARPLPPLREPDLFPEGARFRAREEGDRVRIERVPE